MKKIISLFILIFSIFSFYSPSQTLACSCMMPESPEKESERADYVFIWTVEKISEVSIFDEVIDEIFPSTNSVRIQNEVYFKNITNIKWIDSTSFSLTTPQQSASCGINFQIDKEYIVYASQDEKWNISAWLCGRTNLTEYAQEDLGVFAKILEQNNKQQTPINYDDLPQNNYLKIILALVWILLLSMVGIYKLSKKDSK